jgi:hypothetical protein
MAHPKYGKNELNHLVLCPRCTDTVPVFLRSISDRYHSKLEAHCLRCHYYGHKDGTFIKDLNAEGRISSL